METRHANPARKRQPLPNSAKGGEELIDLRAISPLIF